MYRVVQITRIFVVSLLLTGIIQFDKAMNFRHIPHTDVIFDRKKENSIFEERKREKPAIEGTLIPNRISTIHAIGNVEL